MWSLLREERWLYLYYMSLDNLMVGAYEGISRRRLPSIQTHICIRIYRWYKCVWVCSCVGSCFAWWGSWRQFVGASLIPLSFLSRWAVIPSLLAPSMTCLFVHMYMYICIFFSVAHLFTNTMILPSRIYVRSCLQTSI